MTTSSTRNYQADIDIALRLKRTSEIVSAFISGNPITKEEIPALISSTYEALLSLHFHNKAYF
ncbi:MucR family transcriptional regulator [Falsochrobactrum ovis]|uniref:ROS/MUCR transcriptional regulator protein n=1 Tax=Falsochrobactrum ovis TaxID=1293442 RepID=A0A364JRR5_9HYPH|nr:MucR family transcriptional regulator [Falsochrobactrum ovis]RAK25590.1 ROS/MUCR transcriptional regulator protein [Falsochrobactrum ovis]